ncbi:MAG: hypothetical protein ACXVCP_19125 [Bdellovibrio sp.]
MKNYKSSSIKGCSKIILAMSLLMVTKTWAVDQEIDWSNQAKCSVTFYSVGVDGEKFEAIPEQSKLIEMNIIKREDGTETNSRSGSEVFSLDDWKLKIKAGFSKSPNSNPPIFSNSIVFSKGEKVLSSTTHFSDGITNLGGSSYFIMTNLDITNPEVATELAKLPPDTSRKSLNRVARGLYPDSKHAVYSVSVDCTTSNIKQIKVD